MSLDPVLGSFSAPQTLIRYAYVVNNPLKYTDPTGEAIPLLLLLIFVGAGIGAGVGGGPYAYHVATTGAEWNWRDFGVAVGIGALGGVAAGATFGLGAAAFGVTSMAGLAALGWGATFAIGAVSGVLTYSFERAVIGATGGGWGWGPWEAAAAGVSGGGLAVFGKWIGPKVANWWGKARLWWNENVRGLRNGAYIGSDGIDWAISKWMGRGKWSVDWANDGGFQVSRMLGKYRIQARYEAWGRGAKDPPHLNLEMWDMSGLKPVLFRNNHIFFYDIGP